MESLIFIELWRALSSLNYGEPCLVHWIMESLVFIELWRALSCSLNYGESYVAHWSVGIFGTMDQNFAGTWILCGGEVLGWFGRFGRRMKRWIGWLYRIMKLRTIWLSLQIVYLHVWGEQLGSRMRSTSRLIRRRTKRRTKSTGRSPSSWLPLPTTITWRVPSPWSHPTSSSRRPRRWSAARQHRARSRWTAHIWLCVFRLRRRRLDWRRRVGAMEGDPHLLNRKLARSCGTRATRWQLMWVEINQNLGLGYLTLR